MWSLSTQTSHSTSTSRRFYGGGGIRKPGGGDESLLVLWQGYPVEEAEWIPASFFSDPDALQEDVRTGRIPEEQ